MERELSLSERKYVEKVLDGYQEKKITKIEQLRALNKQASQGAYIFSLIFGIIGTLFLGIGMCFGLKVFNSSYLWLGIIIGLIGVLMVSVNYFIFRKMLRSGKEKYAEQILTLSKSLLNE